MKSMVSHKMFEMLAPVLYANRIYGLQPLKWKKTEQNYILFKSPAYMTYSYATILFYIIASIYGLNQIYKIQMVYSIRFGGMTERFVTCLDLCVIAIPPIISVISNSVNVQTYLKYLQHLSNCDFFLKKEPLECFKYFFVTAVTIILTASLLIFDMTMWIVLNTEEENPFLLFCYFFPFYVCYSYTMIVELLYWQSVHSIKTRLLIINKKISDFIEDASGFLRKVDKKKINNLVDTLKVDFVKKELKNINTLKNELAKTPNQLSTTSPKETRELINAYQELTEATTSINEYFGFIILAIILGCLLHLLVTPYDLYAIIFNTGNGIFIVSQSFWMIGHVLRLLLIVEPCHGCSNESKKTSTLVCKLLCLELEEEVKKSLEFFIIYLSQCKIEFTAFGLTEIHRGLLATIAGAVTTYLVILFQFKS